MPQIPIPESLALSQASRKVIAELDRRVEEIAQSVRNSELWDFVTGTDSNTKQKQALVREVMLAVYWYQRHTTEAGFHMLGRLPKDSGKLLTSLLAHKADEAEHGLWALRDYLQLGGNQEIADGPPSPATFAVAAVWWWMAHIEDPIGYLGAEYLFEYLTAILSAEISPIFDRQNVPQNGLDFIRDHASEDEKHTQLIRANVGRAVDAYPDSIPAIFRCFDYFHQVYPMPVWFEALERARRTQPS